MQLLSWKRITVYAVLIFLVFPSCLPQKKSAIDNAMADRTRVEIDRTRVEIDRARMESEQDIVQGDYNSALDVYADACRKYPEDQTLFTNYDKTRKDIQHAADELFSREDFASSGRAYYVLLKNKSSCRELFRELSLDRKFLHARLRDCSSHLSQRALAEYRKGNLAEAISIWKSILVFDPNNARVVKAIKTATAQMKNL